MTVELGIVLSIVSVVLAVATFFVGRKSAAKTDGKEEGIILTEVRQIGGDVRDIKADITQIKSEQGNQRDRLTRLETRVDLYHGSSRQEEK